MEENLALLLSLRVLDEQGDNDRGSAARPEDFSALAFRGLATGPLVSPKMEYVDG
ncbi:hypothetical protein D3C71_2024440 [compost metagenome]